MAALTAKAEHYCAKAEHCRADVRHKLKEWSATEEQTDEIIDGLYAQNYINDERYCRAFAHDKLRYQKWGRRKIKAALQAKQLPNNAIEEALNGVDEEEYEQVLKRIIAGKKGNTPQQITRFCLQRGFTGQEIRKFVKGCGEIDIL